jgi:hypothetical protein
MRNNSSVAYAVNGIAAFLGLPMFIQIGTAVVTASRYRGADIQRDAWSVGLLLLGVLLLLLRKPVLFIPAYLVVAVAYVALAMTDTSIHSTPLTLWLIPIILLLVALGAVFTMRRSAA